MGMGIGMDVGELTEGEKVALSRSGVSASGLSAAYGPAELLRAWQASSVSRP